MKVLFIQPGYPDTFWSLKHALKFISKKAVYPPLGLMTVSAMTPVDWTKKLIDLNASFLEDEQIMWADLVFISAMSVQSASVFEIIAKCKSLNKKMVAGGPLFTEEPERFSDVDYLVLNEAEITFPLFLADLEKGVAKHIYQTNEFADLTKSPVPDYSLINNSHYASHSIQFSRGCPFNCEFCDITALLGHKVRTKTTQQILAELTKITETGWKGGVFFVDDNFIGNKKILKLELLPAIISWMEKNKYPFTFIT
ncbi:MAG TPA: radical SAM protein, partial [Draconibacterium sp.]|nr:radical SAM protein [Draconibacterium sp.]